MACRYADHVIFMKEGRIAAAGPPAEVVSQSLVWEVFGVESSVIIDPKTQKPLVLPRRTVENLQ
jgi:iron complex transport system ATP-binding protein